LIEKLKAKQPVLIE